MTNIEQVNQILSELNSDSNVTTSLVILKSGMHVSGQPPNEVNLDTFVAMASILITAAESATSDINGKFENIFLELDRSYVIIETAGRKGALVVITKDKKTNGYLNAQIKKAAMGLGAAL